MINIICLKLTLKFIQIKSKMSNFVLVFMNLIKLCKKKLLLVLRLD